MTVASRWISPAADNGKRPLPSSIDPGEPGKEGSTGIVLGAEYLEQDRRVHRFEV